MSLKRASLPAITLLAAIVPTACGGDDDGGLECAAFAPCGGDPVGEWSFDDICLESPVPDGEGCAGSSVDLSDLTASGTLTIEEDGTYSSEFALAGDISVHLPESCLPEGLSCEELSTPDETCSASGSICDCVSTLDMDPVADSGAWEASGEAITLLPDSDDPEEGDYCVDGDVLTIQFEADGTTATYRLTRL